MHRYFRAGQKSSMVLTAFVNLLYVSTWLLTQGDSDLNPRLELQNASLVYASQPTVCIFPNFTSSSLYFLYL